MYEYIQGKVADLNPAAVVIDNQGIGYLMQITLNTFAALEGKNQAVLFVHQAISETTNELYGFSSKTEREIFRLLLSVSGVGASTARMILSALSPDELKTAIANGDARTISSAKGVGAKTAQRIIVDLKDKIGKADTSGDFLTTQNNTSRNEALSALVMLGFAQTAVEKVLDKIVQQEPNLSVEDLVKKALKTI